MITTMVPVQESALDDLLGHGLAFDRKGRPISFLRMGQLKFERSGYDRIGLTTLPGRLGPVEISTVWLGMDHSYGYGPRLIFETMIFCDDENLDTACWRYSTLKQAAIGHRRVVGLVKLLQRPPKVLAKPHKTRNRHWR